jgi:simple sugar transport system substrate-binding protein
LSKQNEVGRRDWLKYASGAIAGLAVGGLAGYFSNPSVPSGAGTTTTVTETQTVLNTVTAGGDSPFKDIRVMLEAGGGEGDPFSHVIVQGAKEAERRLGCKVDLIFSDWNYEKIVDDFRRAIPSNPDGIVINAGPGYDAFKDLVDQAFSKGIIVTDQNNDVPKFRELYGAKGYGYVGALDNYAGGRTLASFVVNKYNIKPGEEAAVWGRWELGLASAVQRDIGFADYLEKEAGLKVTRPNSEQSWWTDPETAVAPVTSYLLAHPNLKVVSGNCFGLMGGIFPNIIDSIGKKPGDIKVATYDILPLELDMIGKGYYQALLDQQQYLQGFLPVVQICLSKLYKFSGLTVDTASGIVDDTNYQAVLDLVKKGYR